jgi:ABC-type multidrug transport system permease subunit
MQKLKTELVERVNVESKMKVSHFAVLILSIFAVGLIFFFLGSDWLMFALFVFGVGLALIFLKVGNWWRRVKENI